MAGSEECSSASTFLRKEGADKKRSRTKGLSVTGCVAIWCCVLEPEWAAGTGSGGPQATGEAELPVRRVTFTMHMPLGEMWKLEVGCLP